MPFTNASDFGPFVGEFPEQEWLLHWFTIVQDDEEPEPIDHLLTFGGPNGRYIGGRADVVRERRKAAIDIWITLQDGKAAYAPNENLEVHERFNGGDWRKLTSQELCTLAEEYQPLKYWWLNA